MMTIIQSISRQLKTLRLLIVLSTHTAIAMGRTYRQTDLPDESSSDSVKIWIETGGVGHVWLSVGSGESLTVYSYGNYAAPADKSSGAAGLLPGKGVMLRFEGLDAARYIQGKIEKNGATEYWVADAKGQDLRHICDSIFNTSLETPTTGTYKNHKSARFFSKYRLLRYNCATFSVNALSAAKSKLFYKKDGTRRVKRLRLIAPAWANSFLHKKATQTQTQTVVVILGVHQPMDMVLALAVH